MIVNRPSGEELLMQGSIEELSERLREEQMTNPGTTGRVYGPGETMTLNNGTRMKVTRDGLRMERDKKKKECNRKKNKAARKARKKTRR